MALLRNPKLLLAVAIGAVAALLVVLLGVLWAPAALALLAAHRGYLVLRFVLRTIARFSLRLFRGSIFARGTGAIVTLASTAYFGLQALMALAAAFVIPDLIRFGRHLFAGAVIDSLEPDAGPRAPSRER